jgi:capsular exopolysaccharide synthesis family protein
VLAAGLMLGLMSGVFAALVNDQSDSKFKTAQEIDSAVSIPVLGYINKLPVGRRRAFVPSTSAQSESFRLLRTMLLSDVRSGKLSSLSATSASPSDGKSTLLLNIAASFASLKMPVVVLEADMRRPTFRKRLQLKNKIGLSDVLNNSATIEQAVCETKIPNLKVIHAGTSVSAPAELLQSEAFDNLLKELRTDFVLTVVDVGPILAVSDPLVVAQKVDGTLLVVRPSVDTRQQVLGAADRLRAGNVNLLGMLVNAFGSSSDFHGSRYGYDVTYASKPAFELA